MNIKRFNMVFARAMYSIAILALVFSVTGSAYAQEPTPWLIAFPENDAVDGWEWPDGATVYLTIDNAPEGFIREGTAQVTTWGDPRTYVRFDFGGEGGYNLNVGDMVTLTDEFGQTTTHTVQNLAVTEANGDTDTVSGTANIGAIVQVWPHGTDYFIEDKVEDGTWTANFGALGFYEIEQTGGRSQIVIDGNATAVDWHVTYSRFTVFPEWEWFDGLDWPNGATVTITVEGKEAVCTTEGTSWNYFFNGGFPEGCDVVVGDIVTFSYGETIRTHTVQNLAITKVNQEDDIVKGAANAGAEIYVWPHATGQEQKAITNRKGKWDVDLTGIYDIKLGDGGRAEIRDEMGNATAVDWYIPNPRLIAFPAMDQIFGYGWPYGSRVNLNINGKHIAGTYVQGAPWDPNDIMAYFDFGGLHDLVAGDVVTLSGRDMENNYTVQNLTVTEANADANTVSGTSDPYETVYVWQHEPGPQLPFEANEDGEWLADLNGYYDIHPGSSGRSEIRDEVGNATAVDWRSPNIRFSVFPEWEYIEGWEWPDGATVYATIDGKSDCFAEGTAGYSGDPITFVQMWFPKSCDAVVGDVVTLTDNVTTRQHTIQNLAVTGANADEDTVSGTAKAGAQVHVWPHGYNELLPTADADGNWTADFTETGPDLVGGMAGRTEIRDEMGNATAMEWGVPATLFVTSIEDVIANDGVCTLREAVIAAKTNAPSGEAIGECPAGSEFATDTILLTANQTYSLTINGSDEYYSYTGDLDILDNSAATDLIIMVEGGGNATISQDALVDDRVLEIHGATVQIEGLTIAGGSNVEIGGGVHIAGGTLIMNVSTVSGNVANYGGGIYNNPSGTLNLTGSTISGNTANVDGGGLENGGTLTVDASTFSANSATYGGGAIFTYAGTVTIQNGSVFGGDPNAGQGNTANYGGGIAVWSGNLNLADSTVSGNTVSWVGGGIKNGINGTVTVNESTISNNSAEWDAGGLYNEGTMMVHASVVSGNTATFQGGGIGNYEGDLTISASTVSGNSSGDGGGVVNWPNSTLTVDASTFTSNSAGGGGGLRNQGTTTITNESQFTGNTVGWIGGAITNDSGGVLLVKRASIISGNSSDGFAGGLYNDSASMLTVMNSTITGNVSVYGGGGIMNEGMLTVDDSVLSANTSGQGGGLYNPGTATITNTIVGDSSNGEGNTGTDGGGGLFNIGNMTVNNSRVIGNNGTTYGGGLFNWIGGMLIIDNTMVANNSANEGGGLHNKEGSVAIIQNRSIFSSNYAEISVGGIQNWGTITITESILRENTSPGENGDAIANTGPEGSTVSITASCIIGNGDTAVFNDRPVFLNFTGNWWGDASGPSGFGSGSGDSVSDWINFADWLLEPPVFCAQ